MGSASTASGAAGVGRPWGRACAIALLCSFLLSASVGVTASPFPEDPFSSFTSRAAGFQALAEDRWHTVITRLGHHGGRLAKFAYLYQDGCHGDHAADREHEEQYIEEHGLGEHKKHLPIGFHLAERSRGGRVTACNELSMTLNHKEKIAHVNDVTATDGLHIEMIQMTEKLMTASRSRAATRSLASSKFIGSVASAMIDAISNLVGSIIIPLLKGLGEVTVDSVNTIAGMSPSDFANGVKQFGEGVADLGSKALDSAEQSVVDYFNGVVPEGASTHLRVEGYDNLPNEQLVRDMRISKIAIDFVGFLGEFFYTESRVKAGGAVGDEASTFASTEIGLDTAPGPDTMKYLQEAFGVSEHGKGNFYDFYTIPYIIAALENHGDQDLQTHVDHVIIRMMKSDGMTALVGVMGAVDWRVRQTILEPEDYVVRQKDLLVHTRAFEEDDAHPVTSEAKDAVLDFVKRFFRAKRAGKLFVDALGESGRPISTDEVDGGTDLSMVAANWLFKEWSSESAKFPAVIARRLATAFERSGEEGIREEMDSLTNSGGQPQPAATLGVLAVVDPVARAAFTYNVKEKDRGEFDLDRGLSSEDLVAISDEVVNAVYSYVFSFWDDFHTALRNTNPAEKANPLEYFKTMEKGSGTRDLGLDGLGETELGRFLQAELVSASIALALLILEGVITLGASVVVKGTLLVFRFYDIIRTVNRYKHYARQLEKVSDRCVRSADAYGKMLVLKEYLSGDDYTRNEEQLQDGFKDVKAAVIEDARAPADSFLGKAESVLSEIVEMISTSSGAIKAYAIQLGRLGLKKKIAYNDKTGVHQSQCDYLYDQKLEEALKGNTNTELIGLRMVEDGDKVEYKFDSALFEEQLHIQHSTRVGDMDGPLFNLMDEIDSLNPDDRTSWSQWSGFVRGVRMWVVGLDGGVFSDASTSSFTKVTISGEKNVKVSKGNRIKPTLSILGKKPQMGPDADMYDPGDVMLFMNMEGNPNAYKEVTMHMAAFSVSDNVRTEKYGRRHSSRVVEGLVQCAKAGNLETGVTKKLLEAHFVQPGSITTWNFRFHNFAVYEDVWRIVPGMDEEKYFRDTGSQFYYMTPDFTPRVLMQEEKHHLVDRIALSLSDKNQEKEYGRLEILLPDPPKRSGQREQDLFRKVKQARLVTPLWGIAISWIKARHASQVISSTVEKMNEEMKCRFTGTVPLRLSDYFTQYAGVDGHSWTKYRVGGLTNPLSSYSVTRSLQNGNRVVGAARGLYAEKTGKVGKMFHATEIEVARETSDEMRTCVQDCNKNLLLAIGHQDSVFQAVTNEVLGPLGVSSSNYEAFEERTRPYRLRRKFVDERQGLMWCTATAFVDIVPVMKTAGLVDTTVQDACQIHRDVLAQIGFMKKNFLDLATACFNVMAAVLRAAPSAKGIPRSLRKNGADPQSCPERPDLIYDQVTESFKFHGDQAVQAFVTAFLKKESKVRDLQPAELPDHLEHLSTIVRTHADAANEFAERYTQDVEEEVEACRQLKEDLQEKGYLKTGGSGNWCVASADAIDMDPLAEIRLHRTALKLHKDEADKARTDHKAAEASARKEISDMESGDRSSMMEAFQNELKDIREKHGERKELGAEEGRGRGVVASEEDRLRSDMLRQMMHGQESVVRNSIAGEREAELESMLKEFHDTRRQIDHREARVAMRGKEADARQKIANSEDSMRSSMLSAFNLHRKELDDREALQDDEGGSRSEMMAKFTAEKNLLLGSTSMLSAARENMGTDMVDFTAGLVELKQRHQCILDCKDHWRALPEAVREDLAGVRGGPLCSDDLRLDECKDDLDMMNDAMVEWGAEVSGCTQACHRALLSAPTSVRAQMGSACQDSVRGEDESFPLVFGWPRVRVDALEACRADITRAMELMASALKDHASKCWDQCNRIQDSFLSFVPFKARLPDFCHVGAVAKAMEFDDAASHEDLEFVDEDLADLDAWESPFEGAVEIAAKRPRPIARSTSWFPLVGDADAVNVWKKFEKAMRTGHQAKECSRTVGYLTSKYDVVSAACTQQCNDLGAKLERRSDKTLTSAFLEPFSISGCDEDAFARSTGIGRDKDERAPVGAACQRYVTVRKVVLQMADEMEKLQAKCVDARTAIGTVDGAIPQSLAARLRPCRPFTAAARFTGSIVESEGVTLLYQALQHAKAAAGMMTKEANSIEHFVSSYTEKLKSCSLTFIDLSSSLPDSDIEADFIPVGLSSFVYRPGFSSTPPSLQAEDALSRCYAAVRRTAAAIAAKNDRECKARCRDLFNSSPPEVQERAERTRGGLFADGASGCDKIRSSNCEGELRELREHLRQWEENVSGCRRECQAAVLATPDGVQEEMEGMCSTTTPHIYDVENLVPVENRATDYPLDSLQQCENGKRTMIRFLEDSMAKQRSTCWSSCDELRDKIVSILPSDSAFLSRLLTCEPASSPWELDDDDALNGWLSRVMVPATELNLLSTEREAHAEKMRASIMDLMQCKNIRIQLKQTGQQLGYAKEIGQRWAHRARRSIVAYNAFNLMREMSASMGTSARFSDLNEKIGRTLDSLPKTNQFEGFIEQAKREQATRQRLLEESMHFFDFSSDMMEEKHKRRFLQTQASLRQSIVSNRLARPDTTEAARARSEARSLDNAKVMEERIVEAEITKSILDLHKKNEKQAKRFVRRRTPRTTGESPRARTKERLARIEAEQKAEAERMKKEKLEKQKKLIRNQERKSAIRLAYLQDHPRADMALFDLLWKADQKELINRYEGRLKK